MRDGICFEKENVVANDMQSATTRSEWRDLSAFSPSVKTEDQPVFELAARLATGKPDFMVQVPHKRNIRFPQKREPDIWSEWRDLSAFSPSVKTEDQPVFELAARLATGKPDFMVQVPHKRNIRFPQKREPDIWSEWRDLNPRPLGPEPSAIPNFATPR